MLNPQTAPPPAGYPFNPRLDGPIWEAFVFLWEKYPNKKDKKRAWVQFRKMKPRPGPVLVSRIAKAIELQSGSWDWTKENGAFVPAFKTYVYGQRWEDVWDRIEDEGETRARAQIQLTIEDWRWQRLPRLTTILQDRYFGGSWMHWKPVAYAALKEYETVPHDDGLALEREDHWTPLPGLLERCDRIKERRGDA